MLSREAHGRSGMHPHSLTTRESVGLPEVGVLIASARFCLPPVPWDGGEPETWRRP